MPDALPQMLQPLPEGVNGEDVDDADEVALLRSIDDVQGVLQVRQQTPVLGSKVRWARLLRAGMKTTF